MNPVVPRIVKMYDAGKVPGGLRKDKKKDYAVMPEDRWTCSRVIRCVENAPSVNPQGNRDFDGDVNIDGSFTLNGQVVVLPTCTDIIDCIESAVALDLSQVVVMLGEINGDVTFTSGTTIDWTNTTNTGTQIFDNSYIANYLGSTINYIGTIFNSTNSTYNYDGDTMNYTDVLQQFINSTIVYDSTSEVTFEGDIFIGGNIYNVTIINNNPSTVVEEGPGVSRTDITNVSVCDGTPAVSTPIDPTLLDSIQLVVGGFIAGSDLGQGLPSGAPAIYGSPSEQRGLALTPLDVNDTDFGVSFKFGDSARIKATNFGFSVPLTDTINGILVEVTYTSTADSVSVDCITMKVYHSDGSTFTSGVDVYEAGVLKVAGALSLDFNSNAIVTDMGGGVARIDIVGGGGGGGGAIATEHADQVYNGTDIDRQLPSTPLSEESLHITTDSGTNLILDVDYAVSVDTIIWIIPPVSGERLYASWIKASGTNITDITEEFLGDGLSDTFTLAQTYLTGAKVYLNGLRQYSSNYIIIGTTLHFVVAPGLGVEIVLDYKF